MKEKIIFLVDEENQGIREELDSVDDLKARVATFLDEKVYMVNIKKRAAADSSPVGGTKDVF